MENRKWYLFPLYLVGTVHGLILRVYDALRSPPHSGPPERGNSLLPPR